MILKPVLKKNLQDPLCSKHREVHPEQGYYEQMKRYSDDMTEEFISTLTDAGLPVKLSSLTEDYTQDIDLYINHTLAVSLKTPLTVRDAQPIELLREDATNRWRASWGMTSKAKCFIWYSPDRTILIAHVNEVQRYILANVHPLTNNASSTRKKLEKQSRPSNVVNRWLTNEEILSLPSSTVLTPDTKQHVLRVYFKSLAGKS